MTSRHCLIWLSHFWPLVPGASAVLFAGWLFWGLGFWLSVFLPIAAGAAVWWACTMLDMAAGIGRS